MIQQNVQAAVRLAIMVVGAVVLMPLYSGNVMAAGSANETAVEQVDERFSLAKYTKKGPGVVLDGLNQSEQAELIGYIDDFGMYFKVINSSIPKDNNRKVIALYSIFGFKDKVFLDTGNWQSELKYKIEYWSKVKDKNTRIPDWDDVKDQYEGKSESVDISKIEVPVIQFKNNPRSQQELQNFAQKLREFQNAILKGVDLNKIRGADEFREFNEGIQALDSDQGYFAYLNKANKSQIDETNEWFEKTITDFLNLVNAMAGDPGTENSVEQVDQSLSLSKYMVGGKVIVITDFSVASPEEILNYLENGEMKLKTAIHRKTKKDIIVVYDRFNKFRKAIPIGAENPNWQNQFVYEVKKIATPKAMPIWDQVKDQYQPKSESPEVSNVEIPVIKIEDNLRIEADFQKLHNRLETIKDQFLKLTNLKDVENEDAYVAFTKTIDFIMSAKLQQYLLNADKHQLQNIENQINLKIKNLYSLR